MLAEKSANIKKEIELRRHVITNAQCVAQKLNSNTQCIEYSREKYWVFSIQDFIHFTPYPWFECSHYWAFQSSLFNRFKIPLEGLFEIEVGNYDCQVLSGTGISEVSVLTSETSID